VNTDTIIALSAYAKDQPLHHFTGLDRFHGHGPSAGAGCHVRRGCNELVGGTIKVYDGVVVEGIFSVLLDLIGRQ
jgi:hypothetical protein